MVDDIHFYFPRSNEYTLHVRDYRRGFNIHAFASQSLFFPAYIEVEADDSSAIFITVNELNSLFGRGVRSTESDFHHGSDRGYFGGTIAIEEVLSKGGKVLGTTKKSLELPYTTGKL